MIIISMTVGIILVFPLHSTAIEAECKNCSCCREGICGRRFVSDHFEEEYCTYGCLTGYGGNQCHEKCRSYCLTCYQAEPYMCDSCPDGQYLSSTYTQKCLNCSSKCKKCTSLGRCEECIPPYFNDEITTDCSLMCLGNCLCEIVGTCSSCAQGYYNITNQCRDVCPTTCSHCTDKSHCQSCQPSYSGDMCCVKDGYCKKCSSSTVCDKCVSGYYGETCNKSCPETCEKTTQETQCERENGTCLSCGVGLYGDYCTLRCSEKCLNNRCYKDTGNCTDGYIGGEYQGPNCTEAEISDKTTFIIVTNTSEVIGIGSAVFVVAAILFVVVILVVVRKWKRNFIQKHKEVGNSVSYINTQTTAAGTEQLQYEQLDEVNDRQCEDYEVIN